MQNAYRSRSDNGYSVAAVAAFTVCAATWLIATANIVMPAFMKGSELRYWSVVRSSSEAGLDFIVSQLDTAYRTGVASSYDDLTVDNSPHITVLPESVVGTGATVSVSVNNVRAPSTAAIYNTQLDDLQTGNVVSNTNLYRVVSATSEYAGLSSTVRVILAPTMITVASTPPTIPFFQNAMFSQNNLSTTGNLITDAYDSRLGAYGDGNKNIYKGDIGSNTSITIGGNTIIGGSLHVHSSPMGSSTAVVATRLNNAVVNNLIEVNGITSGFTATNGPTPAAGDSVLGMENGAPRSGDYASPIDKSQSYAQTTLSVAPSSPQGSYNVGAVSISGNGVVIVREGAPPVSSINVSANQTLYIPPGSYKASSFSVSGNGQFQIESNVSMDTVIYLEGSTPGSNVAQLSGNGVSNATGQPARFQLMTNSAKNVQVSGNANFNGVIYAPSANITISGNGQIYGSVVGKGITSSGNGAIHFDLALADITYAASRGLGYTDSSAGTTVNVVNGLQTVSWQEY